MIRFLSRPQDFPGRGTTMLRFRKGIHDNCLVLMGETVFLFAEARKPGAEIGP
jgi:hypothetical protein